MIPDLQSEDDHNMISEVHPFSLQPGYVNWALVCPAKSTASANDIIDFNLLCKICTVEKRDTKDGQ